MKPKILAPLKSVLMKFDSQNNSFMPSLYFTSPTTLAHQRSPLRKGELDVEESTTDRIPELNSRIDECASGRQPLFTPL